MQTGSHWKPGDMPPSGYNDWHEWADVQGKAGLRQKRCGQCGLWRFPQELGASVIESTLRCPNGVRVITQPVCKECERDIEDGARGEG